MAWSETSLSAAKLQAFNADKPLFVGNNLLTSGAGVSDIFWAVEPTPGTAPVITDPDDTNASYPTSRMTDGYGNLYSQPTTASQANYYVLFDTIPLGSFDSVIIHGLDIGQDSIGVSVTLFVSDNGNFNVAGNTQSIALVNIAAGSNKRPTDFTLGFTGSDKIISNAQFARLKISISAGTFSVVPKISEIVFGTRSQLSRASNTPWDDRGFTSVVSDLKTDTGHIHRVVRSYGGKTFTFHCTPTGVDTYGLDDVTTLDTLAEQTNFFTKPFYFVPKPYSEPHKTYLVYKEDPSYLLPLIDWEEREFQMIMVEQPGFVALGD